MLKHYWVTSPELYEEHGESYRIVECVEATNQTRAKVKFVQKQRENKYQRDGWFWHIGFDENPFVGLEVKSCLCGHGVCNCDLQTPCTIGKPQDPKYDYCGDCVREDNKERWMEEYNVAYEGIRTPLEVIIM